MADTKDSLKKILGGGKPDPEPLPLADEDIPEALTLADMDGQYSTMRPANKPLSRIHIIHKDGKVQTLQYHHIDALSEYNGTSFVFLFSGAKLWELTVEGRNLWRLYDYIALAKWPYIRVATRDFAEEGEVVTAARIKEIVIKSGE